AAWAGGGGVGGGGGGEGGEGGEDGGEVVGHGRSSGRHRRAIRVAGEVREAAHRGRDAAEAGTLAARSGLAERRDANHDERTADHRERFPSEIPALERPGSEVFGQDVRLRDQAADQRLPLRVSQIAG